ncbi:HAD family hydrolase [Longirhabdus pacifica]|uniref:HAD family hydrolase n=1 Tax=Longirhabdus pacifica TaxID=2305227 RepID=UPI0013E8BEBE|nr:HAD-IA family hydrolase [Longirhabdus pacifica]
MIKTVLFDFDGTVANTLPVIFQSFREVFNVHNQVHLSDEDIKQYFGPCEKGIIKRHIDEGVQEEALQLFYNVYEREHDKLAHRNEEMEKILAYLKTKNMNIGLITGKARKSLNISLQRLNMTSLFDLTIAGDEVKEYKPHPEGILKAMQFFHSKPEETIYVGDSNADIAAGLASNITTVGAQWMDNVQQLHFDPSPHYCFTSLSAFEDYLTTHIAH